jgi:hypothetical protein
MNCDRWDNLNFMVIAAFAPFVVFEQKHQAVHRHYPMPTKASQSGSEAKEACSMTLNQFLRGKTAV